MKLFSYWHGELSPLAAECIASWRANTSLETVVLTDATLGAYVPVSELPSTLAAVHPALRSDLVRLLVLFVHGGVWLDATVKLNRPVDFERLLADDYACLYLDPSMTRGVHPENWLIVARQRDESVGMLFALLRAVAEHFPKYSDHPIYRSAFIREHRDPDERYYMMYDCYLYLLHHEPRFVAARKITGVTFSMNAEDSSDVNKHTRVSPFRGRGVGATGLVSSAVALACLAAFIGVSQ